MQVDTIMSMRNCADSRYWHLRTSACVLHMSAFDPKRHRLNPPKVLSVAVRPIRNLHKLAPLWGGQRRQKMSDWRSRKKKNEHNP